MLAERLSRLRARLDALREGRVLSPGVLDRALALFDRGREAADTQVLAALDRDLDKVGVHTAADAWLLRELGVQTGRAGALAVGLAGRAVQALDEVEAQVRRAERATSAGKAPPGAVTALEQSFVRLARAVKVADLFAAAARPARPEPVEGAKEGKDFEIYERVSGREARAPNDPRLAIAELWAGRARTQVFDLVQKRRDLDAAHELLLRLGAEGERDRARRVRLEVAQARERVRSAPAVKSLNDLLRHVRLVARKDAPGAYRSLRALYERAVEAGEPAVAKVARDAASALLPPAAALTAMVERAEREELAAYAGPAGRARSAGGEEPPPPPASAARDPAGEVLAQLAFDLDETKLQAFELAAGCARYFDVEDALSEEIVEAQTDLARPRQRRVSYPTQHMAVEFTNSLDELNNFIITHPRTLVYDLASNRQPLRTYLEIEPPPRPRHMRKTAVRTYVCDASGSMYGPRASFRDALVIAELNNLRLKAARGQPFDPIYFSFFNDIPTGLARVDSGAEATRQIEKLFRHSPAEGQTDITLALMSAFDAIRAAQGRDPYLARATVVLVTDGEDRVDLELIRRTRAPIGSLDIAFSFIALGEENQDLKSLVTEQRAAGGRAFYHHLSDDEIGLARTEFDTSWRTLLPRDVPATPAALEALLPHLEALAAVAEGKAPVAPPRPEGSFDALFPEEPLGAPPGRGAIPGAELARITDLLEAIAEAASLAPADARAAEALGLLTHLLALYGWSHPRYLEAISPGDAAIKAAIARVRLLCRPFG
ncbi:MAG: vWA domain-containing protein [Myxococcaceae bacterium]